MSSTETLQIKNYIGLKGDKPIKFLNCNMKLNTL